jgi:hypothetical protein
VLCSGARALLAQVVEAEVAALLAAANGRPQRGAEPQRGAC